MKTVSREEQVSAPSILHSSHSDLTLGDYAYAVIHEQQRAIVKQEKKVLADKDPEHLHHMRVATRRLRTALQVFGQVVKLPPSAQEKRISSVAKVLGQLRDLDVQMAALKNDYRPNLKELDQHVLDEALSTLKRERRKAFAGVEDTLTGSRYRNLKAAYETWLDDPDYSALAQLPLRSVLPDLLSPLLSELLLHPGWLVEVDSISEEENEILHDLRKTCKHARYQAEFFKSFYGKDFQDWIGDIKTIQDLLGKVHDGQFLLELLADVMPKRTKIPDLQQMIQQAEQEMMAEWQPIRQKYLDPDFRNHLHQMLLEVTPAAQAKQTAETDEAIKN
ncbi:CHAD domain-containing protein [Kovacikia minuta CCNUW1]|uniref:CHAD domain-containing protein n=1 Tax=Kovacikia minuta TaxID=2931930 RepID=UPI001CCFBCFE|nr:CHAD domain-containing protein [Kovacikia minuta]UBF28292.1 CHAD domain-containing protein [Kovacikia minuta CCNUW1]